MHAGQIDNVFSRPEIDMILTVLGKISNKPVGDQGRITIGFGPEDTVFPLINNLVISKINRVCRCQIRKLTVGMQLIANDPVYVHTDFLGKNDSGHGIVYLIPLYVLGEQIKGTSATIVFNEYSCEHDTLRPYIKSNPAKPMPNARSIWHYLPEARDSNKDDWADYLSVKVFAEWQLGSLIYWDRRLYHGSDDFLKKGITEKSALVLFASDDT